jgi:hypothetical protein
MKRTFGLFLPAAILVVTVDAQSQTLADVARSERSRQKAPASKVYTNADLTPPGSAQPVPSPASPPSPASAAPESDAAPAARSGPVDKQGRDERYWRETFETARAELKRAEDRMLVLETQRNELNLQILRQSNLYNRENVLGAQLKVLETELAAVRMARDAAIQRLSALEEELRRSGGPPGWAR